MSANTIRGGFVSGFVGRARLPVPWIAPSAERVVLGLAPEPHEIPVAHHAVVLVTDGKALPRPSLHDNLPSGVEFVLERNHLRVNFKSRLDAIKNRKQNAGRERAST